MLSFMKICQEKPKKDEGKWKIYPKFIVGLGDNSDLMIRGGDFYAIWEEDKKLWSTKEETVLYLIDQALEESKAKFMADRPGTPEPTVLYMWDADSGMIDKWHKYVQHQCRDNFHPLDERLIFSNTETKKTDYASKKLPYPLERIETPAYDELIGTLYSPEERHKLEWAIGAVISGDSKEIQKFIVMYGAPKTGKSTILNVMQDLFDGYFGVFDSRALGSATNVFALEAFKDNPLVAIQHDGDLSRIEDNTRLNSLVSHEMMSINVKFKPTYSIRFNSFLIMGTNKPVKITDSKSGIIRRLIDVSPSGKKIPRAKYDALVSKVKFELGGIAQHCLDVYLEDPKYYEDYIPTTMIGASNDFYNFVLDSYDVFKRGDGTTLKAAWEMYNKYCSDAKVPFPYSQRVFKEELKSYFKEFIDRDEPDANGDRARNIYKGFITNKFETVIMEPSEKKAVEEEHMLELNCTKSLLDDICKDWPAQYASDKGTPVQAWDDVKTKLSDIDTHKEHYLFFPDDQKNLIVVDFDLKDASGKKSFELNAKAAAKWPKTYAETSKSDAGIHLHYIYNGDVEKLSRIYDDNIEIKVFTGKSSLRRKLTRCNDIPIATISTGLPLKNDKKVIDFEGLKNEKALRTVIKRNLLKEYHSGTKPSVEFVKKVLDDAYESGMKYDVSDMMPALLTFAGRSTNHANYCLGLVQHDMKFKSKEEEPPNRVVEHGTEYEDDRLVFFDVEVFSNLFVVVYMVDGKEPISLINPTPKEIEQLMKFKLVGFNNRSYDNHILYARLLGETNYQLYQRSKRLTSKDKNIQKDAKIGAAYNISYTDIYDFSSNKQSLKKWEIEMGIHHQELGLPWDKPVEPNMWEKVAEYCQNDVRATAALFHHLTEDWKARQILADLADGSVNDTTNTLTTKIVFGDERYPQLVYTDLATGEQSVGR